MPETAASITVVLSENSLYYLTTIISSFINKVNMLLRQNLEPKVIVNVENTHQKIIQLRLEYVA